MGFGWFRFLLPRRLSVAAVRERRAAPAVREEVEGRPPEGGPRVRQGRAGRQAPRATARPEPAAAGLRNRRQPNRDRRRRRVRRRLYGGGRRVYVEHPVLFTVVRSGSQTCASRSAPAAGRGAPARSTRTAATSNATPAAASAAAPPAAPPTTRPAPARRPAAAAPAPAEVPAAQHHLPDGGQPLHGDRRRRAADAARGSARGASACSARRSAFSPATSARAILDCCGGFCSKATGATEGVCMDVATTGTGNCTHDGVLCNGCGSCCSKNCGPWALTGVQRLPARPRLQDPEQPLHHRQRVLRRGYRQSSTARRPAAGTSASASARRTRATRCRAGSASSPAAPTPAPTPRATARARSRPRRSAAPTTRSACRAASARAACADGGTTGIFSGTDPKCCRQPGQTCNTAAECCGLSPCVPDSTGTLRCLTTTPNDGGIVCVRQRRGCTATGDCCTGLRLQRRRRRDRDLRPAVHAAVRRCRRLRPLRPGVQRRTPPAATACSAPTRRPTAACTGQQGCTCYTPL